MNTFTSLNYFIKSSTKAEKLRWSCRVQNRRTARRCGQFVTDVLTQARRKTVPYTPDRSSEASVAETFVCSWDDACPGESWSEQTTTTVGDEVDVIRQVHGCWPDNNSSCARHLFGRRSMLMIPLIDERRTLVSRCFRGASSSLTTSSPIAPMLSFDSIDRCNQFLLFSSNLLALRSFHILAGILLSVLFRAVAMVKYYCRHRNIATTCTVVEPDHHRRLGHTIFDWSSQPH